MQLATTSRTILIPTRTTIRRLKQRTAGVACARLRRISQVCWQNDVVQSRNLPRRLDVFDALDAGAEDAASFHACSEGRHTLDPPQTLGGVSEGKREHRSGFDSFHSENLFVRPIPRCSPMISDVS